MDEKEYIIDRLDDQINWYDKKSAQNKKYYTFFRIISVTMSACIPILTGMVLEYNFLLHIIAIIGGLLVISESITSLFKWQENWTRYRSITEQLRHEKIAFQTNTGVYRDVEAPFADLVERCENIISSENANWTNLNSNKKEGKR